MNAVDLLFFNFITVFNIVDFCLFDYVFVVNNASVVSENSERAFSSVSLSLEFFIVGRSGVAMFN